MSVILPLPALLLPPELVPVGQSTLYGNNPTLPPLRLAIAGEQAFMLYIEPGTIHPRVAAMVPYCCELQSPLLGHTLLEQLPAYASILISFNPLQHSHLSLLPLLIKQLMPEAAITPLQQAKQLQQGGKTVELPVWYSSDSGADLLSVAKAKNLTPEEVISLHSGTSYQVYAIGFAPGFAYLGELPAELALPRLSSPRAKVPAGAVAIADRQTAVYPAASPGGWHLLGLCPIRMFNPQQEPAMPVAVGDQVRFVPVSEREFQLLGGAL